jgi:hypothetical protein
MEVTLPRGVPVAEVAAELGEVVEEEGGVDVAEFWLIESSALEIPAPCKATMFPDIMH